MRSSTRAALPCWSTPTTVAGYTNRHFGCVKVGREERPNVDQVYMQASEVLAGQGGWPLHAFALPDGRFTPPPIYR